MSTPKTQQVRVMVDVSLELSTRHDAAKVRDIVDNGARRIFPNNGKHIHAIRFAEEAAIYHPEDSDGWQTVIKPDDQRARIHDAAPELFEVVNSPELDAAHDALSEALENTKSTGADVRRAAIAMCLALNAHHQKRAAVIAKVRGDQTGDYSEFDQTRANAEGWGIFNGNEIQRLDEDALINKEGQLFPDDEGAVAFVSFLANAGSAYHIAAMKLTQKARA